MLGVVLAAYLLVVQAALTGMVLGARAAPGPNAFTVLCASSGTAKDAPQSPSEPHAPPNCCVLGCSVLGGGAAPVPDAAFSAPRLGFEPAAPVAASFAAVSRTPDPSPRTTRAPPATA